MPWIVGIDEAGYGPNLGPLVMTSVLYRVPDELMKADIWEELKSSVRRHSEPADDRLFIEDSKLVYSTARGLFDLETSVLGVLSSPIRWEEYSLNHYLETICPTHREDLQEEVWFTGTSRLPIAASHETLESGGKNFDESCTQKGIQGRLFRSVICCPRRFNLQLGKWGSKGAVLAEALSELIPWNLDRSDSDESVHFFVDKHGGRNTYTAILQNSLAVGMVTAQEEGMERSVYRVLGLNREVFFTFQPRADTHHFSVALASMISKYVREVLMLEFNRYWKNHLPGLKPTAGYPGDAIRFFKEIGPIVKKLGIPKSALWRER